ncbi:MAG TPA: hypothetical protein VFT55_08680 [Planctomycetota bacterium]|nr:hypothetical protein [Planctomycetota bacterium]
MHRSSFLPLLAIGGALLGGASLTAQTVLALPGHADLADAQHELAMPFGTPGFRTQILVDAAAIAPSGALLHGIAFRCNRQQTAIPAAQVQNVTVTLSQTSVSFGALAPTFANNITGPTTVAFQGTVSLPAVAVTYAGPTPWNVLVNFAAPYVFTTSQGNLLIDIIGNNPPSSGFPTHYLDAAQGGGSSTVFGERGDNPNDQLFLGVHAGNGTTRAVAPGNTLEFTSTLTFAPTPGVVAIGLAAQPVPIDLSVIGAPTNFLYIDPLVLAAHSWNQSFIGWYSVISVAVPNDPTLIHTMLYAQSAIFEPAANPLGLVLSAATETRLGDANEQLPMQQLNAADPAATTGTLVDWSFTTTPDYGSVVMCLTGTFF